MKAKEILAVLSIAAAGLVSADVQALYWQVTPETNVNNVDFTAAALGYDDGAGHKQHHPGSDIHFRVRAWDQGSSYCHHPLPDARAVVFIPLLHQEGEPAPPAEEGLRP